MTLEECTTKEKFADFVKEVTHQGIEAGYPWKPKDTLKSPMEKMLSELPGQASSIDRLLPLLTEMVGAIEMRHIDVPVPGEVMAVSEERIHVYPLWSMIVSLESSNGHNYSRMKPTLINHKAEASGRAFNCLRMNGDYGNNFYGRWRYAEDVEIDEFIMVISSDMFKRIGVPLEG